MTIATETLDNIEATDWTDWTVRQFYAANVDCIDISEAAIQVEADNVDLAVRADNLAYLLCAYCARKHGSTALAEYALSR
jgi:hypothetical protein